MSAFTEMGRGRTERIGDMTPEFALSAGHALIVACPGCNATREADLLSLAVARPKQFIRTMVFRCGRCGSVGRPMVTGWVDGRVTWTG